MIFLKALLTSRKSTSSLFAFSLLAAFFYSSATAFAKNSPDDKNWPQFRYDSFRSSSTPHQLPKKLKLLWQRELPAPRPAWSNKSYNFDPAYEPIVWGGTLLLSFNSTDSVKAYDIRTGKENWTYTTDGPVRIAPVVYKGKVFVQSDDGYLYCLNIKDGSLIWKKPGFPYGYETNFAQRKYFGNKRIISRWPQRGGMLLFEGKLFYTAGLFQTEGVFMHCIDAETGQEVWLNDAVGSIVGITGGSHDIKGVVSGHIPQGYLVQSESDKSRFVLPGNRSGTRDFDFATGQFRAYRQDTQRAWKNKRFGWAVQKDGFGHRGYPVEVHAGDQKIDPATLKEMGFDEKVWTLIAAQDRLFVISKTKKGDWKISCFGARPKGKPPLWKLKNTPLKKIKDKWTSTVRKALAKSEVNDRGLGIVWGVGRGRIVEELVQQSLLHIVTFDPDRAKVKILREKFMAAGLYGTRVSVHLAKPFDWELPPYMIRLVMSADRQALGLSKQDGFLSQLLRILRPYGGAAWLPTTSSEHSQLMAENKILETKIDLQKINAMSVITRKGPLPGIMDYTKERPPEIEDFDKIARPPFAISWFGEMPFPFASTYRHIKAVPGSPDVVDGLFVSREGSTADVYTGMSLTGKEKYSGAKGGWLFNLFRNKRPKYTQDPIYDIYRPIKIWRGGGCGTDFMGNLEVMRSGCAGYFDIRKNSGTIHFAPSRPGCGRDVNMIAANGMLSFPMQLGCPCNVAMQAAFGFHSAPETEYWAYYTGERQSKAVEDTPIKRIGINFGAIGERNEQDTVWFHQPRVAGHTFSGWMSTFESPEKVSRYYYHSSRIKNNEGYKWVASSGVKGASKIHARLSFEAYAHRTAKKPKIDADLSDACWDGQDPYTLWFEHPGPQQLNAPMGKREFAPLYLRYDDQALYISARSFEAKEVKRKRGSRPPKPSWTVFISELSKTSGEKISNYLEFTINHEGTITADQVSALRIGRPKKVKLSGEISAAAKHKKGDGFYIEMAIPWKFLAKQKIDPTQMIFASRGPNNLRTRYLSQYSKRFERAQPLILDGTDRGFFGQQRPHLIRLTFAEPDESIHLGERVFDVKLQGKTVLTHFDIFKEAGGTRQAIVREFKILASKEVLLELVPIEGETLISGMEIIGEYKLNHKPEFDAFPKTKIIQSLNAKGRIEFRFKAPILDLDHEPVSITWFMDDKPVKSFKDRYGSGPSGSLNWWLYKPEANTEQKHTVTFEVNDGHGGVTKKNWLVNLLKEKSETPVAKIVSTAQVGQAPLSILLDGAGSKDSDGSIKSYSWDLADGHKKTGQQIKHTFEKPGFYHIELTVEDNAGALGVDDIWVYVF